jgi:hypothetical protein
MVRFFALIRVRMVFLRAIRGRRAGCDVRVFIFVFLSSPKGCGKIALARFRERNFFVRAQEESGESFLRLGANDARAIFEEICVSWIFVRANASSRAREERWFPRVYSTKGSERGSRRARFFIFFSFSSLFTSLTLHETFPSFLSKNTTNSHRKRRLKSRKSWARSKSKTARSRNGFA